MTATRLCNSNHILVGLGGTGGKILRAFKMKMFEEFPAEERSQQPVALLYVDSTTEMIPYGGTPRADFRVMGQDASFAPHEFLDLHVADVGQILDNIDCYPSLKGIVDDVSAVKSAIGFVGPGTGQKRRVGRLLFAAHADHYVNALRQAYNHCTQVSRQASRTHIHIFAGLCGGTGSGAVIDAVVQSRKTFPDANILVYAMMPETELPRVGMDHGCYYPNSYAAMSELNALQAGRWFPQDVTGSGEAHYYSDRRKGVADGIFVYSDVNENGQRVDSLQELPTIVSDYIFARIFLVDAAGCECEGMDRVCNFLSMDSFAQEFDETAVPDSAWTAPPVARTKKVGSFGIKQVACPELQVLKHITYAVGERVLYQFKYNHWGENQGFVGEEPAIDYVLHYLQHDRLKGWMLDDRHLTYDEPVLPSDRHYSYFEDEWYNRTIDNAHVVREEANPFAALDHLMDRHYESHFRGYGVEAFFAAKEWGIPEMAWEIRSRIERDLYEKWKVGGVSVVGLQRIAGLLLMKIAEIREKLESRSQSEKEKMNAADIRRKDIGLKWEGLNILVRLAKRNQLFQEYLRIQTEYYTTKTMLVACEFAEKLAARVHQEVTKMETDISAFGQVVSDAIDETGRMMEALNEVRQKRENAQRALIELVDDDAVRAFEAGLLADKARMPAIAYEIRDSILSRNGFEDFGRLARSVTVDDIKDVFDIQLSQIVKAEHDMKADGDKKVLGLDILTFLQQQLKTDNDIRGFASMLVDQGGVFLQLNNEQLQLNLRNNEGFLSPTDCPHSVNRRMVLVSVPQACNEEQKQFADKLEVAFKAVCSQGMANMDMEISYRNPRRNELSVVTVAYCFPMRAIESMKTCQERYERFLHTGNPAIDAEHALILHSEGDGKQLPPLFAVENVTVHLDNSGEMFIFADE